MAVLLSAGAAPAGGEVSAAAVAAVPPIGPATGAALVVTAPPAMVVAPTASLEKVALEA